MKKSFFFHLNNTSFSFEKMYYVYLFDEITTILIFLILIIDFDFSILFCNDSGNDIDRL
jgi:hypothetical protein